MNIFRVLIICLATSGASISQAQEVKKMSSERFIDAEPPYWQVTINCGDGNDTKVIKRPIDLQEWCSSEQENLCDTSKESLSDKLCNSATSTSVNKVAITEKPTSKGSNIKHDMTQTTPSSAAKKQAREALLFEQLKIEEQRILIAQKKLELRSKEIALQKRQLNTKLNN